MEQIQETTKSSKFEPEDFISSMPDNVVSSILDRLPLQDVIKTSVLARNWRFKWAMLSQLVFDNDFFNYLLKTKTGGNNYGRIVSRLLLNHEGVITKFVLYYVALQGCVVLDDEDISQWILFLSRKGIKDLTICKAANQQLLKLPTHLFSCLGLKHLKLHNCVFNPPPAFQGFPNLLSLELSQIQLQSGNFCDFLTRCPLLEILKLGYSHYGPKVKLVEIVKLTNLKVLSFSPKSLDITVTTSLGSILEHVGSLSKLQELQFDFTGCQFIDLGVRKIHPGVRKNFPATRTFLRDHRSVRTLELSGLNLGIDTNLATAFSVIARFMNLQTLEITTIGSNTVSTHINVLQKVNYDRIRRLQLRSVVFTTFIASENEVCLIKYLLACSPFLRKFIIRLHSGIASDEKLMFGSKLLKLHRASPFVDIDLCYF